MLTVVIQAGGQSSRMGQNKALMPFLGQPLIQRVIERLRPIATEMLLTTNQPEAYQPFGLPMFADLHPGGGALSGLHTALACASQPLVAVVACDMPFTNPGLLEHLAGLLAAGRADVAIPHMDGEYEPLHAVYRRETCLPHIETSLREQRLRLISWFPKVQVETVGQGVLLQYDPHNLAFLNLNTPEEFARAEQIARRLQT